MDHATKHVQCVQIRGLPGSCPHNMPNYPPKRVYLSGGGGKHKLYGIVLYSRVSYNIVSSKTPGSGGAFAASCRGA